MFNLQHILYMLISGLLTVALMVIFAIFLKTENSKSKVLRFFAIITVIIHYSSIWVDYFKNGSAMVENGQILPVYPCNVVMWCLLIASLIKNKKSSLFILLAEFCLYVGTICGIVGVVYNINFGNNPTLTDYNVLKGLLSHSTMVFGCIYLKVSGLVKFRVTGAFSSLVGIGIFVISGLLVNALYKAFDMVSPDGMFLISNPYIPFTPWLLALVVVAALFSVQLLYENKCLEKEERTLEKIKTKCKKIHKNK